MSQWRAIFTAFDVRLWYCLAGSFIVALSAWTLIRRTTNTPYTLTVLSINLFRVFLMVPLNRVPNNVSERLMVVSTVLFGFIMATSLQAVMVKYLSYPKYERDVATVQELYDTGMPVLSASNNLILLFESDERPLYVKMSDRFSIINNKSLDILGEVASKRVWHFIIIIPIEASTRHEIHIILVGLKFNIKSRNIIWCNINQDYWSCDYNKVFIKRIAKKKKMKSYKNIKCYRLPKSILKSWVGIIPTKTNVTSSYFMR